MAKVMTKEELEKLIKEQVEETLKAHNQEMTDTIEGQMKELIQEALKDFGKERKKTPFDTGEEDPKGGFSSFAEFAKAVYDAGEGLTNPSPKLKTWLEKSAAIAKAAGSPSQSSTGLQTGGALIPPEFSRTALTRAKERSTILSKAQIVPMNTNVIEIPYLTDFDESQGKVAGNVRFRWVAENEQATGSQLQWKMIELRLREANALVYVPKRLMEFSPVSIEPFITTAVDRALDLALADAFINGTGAGQPLGILNADCLVTIDKETGQSANTLVYENTLNMLARFYGKTGEWYASRTIIPQLGVMQVTVGTGGSAVFIAGGAGGNATGPFPSSLHGAPLVYEPVMPALGTKGDLVLCDWSQYLVGEYTGAAGLQMTESAHLKFDYRQHAFQFTFYIDGQPWWPQAYKPKSGDSLSPFVAIETRS